MTLRILKMAVIFVASYAALTFAYFVTPDDIIKSLHLHLLLRPCEFLISTISGSGTVFIADGALVANGVELELVRGCDGVGVGILLAAGIIGLNDSVSKKAIGLALGLAVVHVLNIVRIVGLFYVMRGYRTHFSDVHNLIAPTFMLVASGLCFVWWARTVSQTAYDQSMS